MQPSVRGVAVLREVVWVEFFKGLVSPDLVCPLGVVVVGNFLVQLLDCHACAVCVSERERLVESGVWENVMNEMKRKQK